MYNLLESIKTLKTNSKRLQNPLKKPYLEWVIYMYQESTHQGLGDEYVINYNIDFCYEFNI